MTKAIVIHSVAANGGDELLQIVLEKGLQSVAGIEVLGYTTNNWHSYPYLSKPPFMNRDLIADTGVSSTIIGRAARGAGASGTSLDRLSLQTVPFRVKRLHKLLDRCDCAILSPGGYMHEYYGLGMIDKVTEKLQAMGKRIYLIGQSVGPFTRRLSKLQARRIFRRVDKIILREPLSADFLEETDADLAAQSHVTTDIAFAYNRLFDYTPSAPTDEKRILLNFREWAQGVEPDRVLKIGRELSERLFQAGFRLEYISTCQGINGYRDDSKVAEEIVTRVRHRHPEFRPKIHTKRYPPRELLRVMEGAGYYVGMRMHGAISAILANVPAFNIGYEPKSLGVYRTVGLSDYTLPLSASTAELGAKIEAFVEEDSDDLKAKYKDILPQAEEKALRTFEHLKN